jgi:uncharacterized protein (TIGR03086 family)
VLMATSRAPSSSKAITCSGCDPACPGLVPETAGHDVAWLVCCDEGYSSSSAAASLQALGPRQATDLIGASRPGAPTHCQWLHLDNQAGRGCHGLCDDCVDREDIMTDIAELHAQALDATGRIVAGIVADRWHADTPCDGWDVRALVNHVVAGNLWAAELAAGGTIEGVGDRLDGDVLGPDPVGSYDASAKAAAAVFHRPGALDAPCAVSYGPVPGSVYAGHRFLDVFIHGWDLAAATGQDTALDAGLRQACREVIEPQLEAFRGAGALAGPLPVPAGASDQTRFLALLGRAG